MTVSNGYHLLGYQSAAAAFFLAWAWVTALLVAKRRFTSSSVLLSVSLFVGFLFYEATAAVFFAPATDLFGVAHSSSLITHLLGVCWNVSTVLLALQWRDGRWDRRKVLALGLFATIACAILLVCFVLIYPGPPGNEYIVTISTLPLGKVYSSAYAISMLLAKILVIVIVVPQIRRVRSAATRGELILVVAGSFLIACFAAMRFAFGHPRLMGVHPEQLELWPFLAHVLGALLYVSGIAFAELGLTLRRITRSALSLRRLLPLCRAGLAVFPAIGSAPELGPGDYWFPDRVNTRLLAAVVLLLDIEVLLSRSGEQSGAAGAEHRRPGTTDVRVAYHEELRRLLGAATRFREICAARPPVSAPERESALRAALLPGEPKPPGRTTEAPAPDEEARGPRYGACV